MIEAIENAKRVIEDPNATLGDITYALYQLERARETLALLRQLAD